jgi:hypothetical protein
VELGQAEGGISFNLNEVGINSHEHTAKSSRKHLPLSVIFKFVKIIRNKKLENAIQNNFYNLALPQLSNKVKGLGFFVFYIKFCLSSRFPTASSRPSIERNLYFL